MIKPEIPQTRKKKVRRVKFVIKSIYFKVQEKEIVEMEFDEEMDQAAKLIQKKYRQKQEVKNTHKSINDSLLYIYMKFLSKDYNNKKNNDHKHSPEKNNHKPEILEKEGFFFISNISDI